MEVSAFITSCMSLVLLFLAASIKADISDESPNRQLVGFKIKQPLILNCNISVEGDFEVKWEKNGTDITQIDELKNRYKILKAERKLEISKAAEDDDGPYSCIVEGKTVQRKEFLAAAFLVARLPSNTNVVEGEKLTIHCVAIGTEPQIYWEYGNITVKNSTGRFILKSDDRHKNAIFTIENVSLDDRGEYRCVIKNPLTEAGMAPIVFDTSYVRVKGKLAALWPFLGICAEVFILCAIILIYERRRNKADLEESDTDPNTEQ